MSHTVLLRSPGRWIAVCGAILALLLAGTGPWMAQAAPGGWLPPAAVPVDPATRTGLAPDVAAASCWEIKELHPASADGPYWLLTPKMTAPEQFWCDMTTDGGGWVRVGAGREQWEADYDGKDRPEELLAEQPPLTRTVQLPATTIDALLDGGRVDNLAEGVRVRRAVDATGTAWQEVRFSFANRDRWAWTMGAEHRVSGWRFDGLTGSGGQSNSFGSGQGLNRVNASIQSQQGYRWGFAYGTQVIGTNSATTYLWSSSNGQGSALPYAEVYLRPRLTTADVVFTDLPDDGSAPIEMTPAAESRAMVNPWGVSGTAGSTSGEADVEVQALEQIGDVMYVGGNFRWVQRDASGSGRVEQSFLAAFNASTGEWITGFRPDLNEQVRALTALPNGTLAVGGDFTTASGEPSPGLVAVDPVTGARVQNWGPLMENGLSPGLVRVRSLEAKDGWLYLGGNFTHMSNPDGSGRVYARNGGRVAAATGQPDNWNPEFNGSVLDLSAAEDGTKTYFSGFFGTSRTETAWRAAAVMADGSGELDPVPWNPVWSRSISTGYQWTIDQRGDRVWVGGAEHSLFDFATSDYRKLGGSITKRGGDFQAIEAEGELVYAGCHCNDWIYQDAYTWPDVGTGWTQADSIGWFGLWDASDGRYVPQFTPHFRLRLGRGIWAIEIADDGTVWAGGDITSGMTSSGGRWLGGFGRWPARDTAAPGRPGNLRAVSQDAGSVTLAWNGAAGAPSGYQILRDDRVIATTNGGLSVTVSKGGANRFFVRAVDAAGNVSASSPVFETGDGNPPPVPVIAHEAEALEVTLDGSGSTDDGSIVEYRWDLGDGSTATGPVVTHAYVTTGRYEVRLTVVDDLGAVRTATTDLEVSMPAPTDAYGAAVLQDNPFLYWRLNEAGGDVAQDYGGEHHGGNYYGGVTRQATGALTGTNDAAVVLDGSSGHVVGRPNTEVSNPGPFSAEVWFRTTTTRGGKLIGFGNQPTGLSSNYDRHVFMLNDGRLAFGVWTGSENRATSAAAYNDGQWHHVVATQGSEGMSLYVDGDLVASNPQTSAQSYTGYWRLGGDRVWSGASSGYLAGTLDEAAVYTTALSADRVASHYRAGTGQPEPNDDPQAAFTAQTSWLSLSVDAGDSTDPDGEIDSYAWDFGDGSTATGVSATHDYAAEGTYTVTLTVTDDRGATASTSKQVTVVEPGDAVTETVVERNASWAWYYETAAPPADWMEPRADLSSWSTGPAPLGFGFAQVATDIDIDGPTSDRPLAAYFVRTFEVADASRVESLVLDTVANDGVVVYVNGVEVGRHNMPAGEITHSSYATSARNVTTANNDPVVIEVPVELLVDGTNVVAVQEHLNYRNTRDVSFELDAVLTSR
ncbi:PKD domain-containing protein [Ornithinicoccus halotolerans]|uniref:PKD domain-containing protein n=1 Tax=Ornithinicoccus halotolerans TaxID=1748220 RepID=UPI001297EA6E|nr:PKD domain-containing protein [Ornithinicoccus halotolerans]